MRKHGVPFDLAERALCDPFSLSVLDPCTTEIRWRTVGKPSSASHVVLFVVHTWPDDEDGEGRIISARRAAPSERKAYEEGQF
ncbi:Membrane protein [Rhodospirillaceae bacterium LM-1]|nr:Membrane protein [Rhodospirillaceae bacterium LM-1]